MRLKRDAYSRGIIPNLLLMDAIEGRRLSTIHESDPQFCYHSHGSTSILKIVTNILPLVPNPPPTFPFPWELVLLLNSVLFGRRVIRSSASPPTSLSLRPAQEFFSYLDIVSFVFHSEYKKIPSSSSVVVHPPPSFTKYTQSNGPAPVLIAA